MAIDEGGKDSEPLFPPDFLFCTINNRIGSSVSPPTCHPYSADAIVKMVKAAICGTDLHILKSDVATGRILGFPSYSPPETALRDSNQVTM
ncbi:uncharacterized protein BT62DRAFT_1007576 [Guyanagaster necrorhizus]|uniref:Alcohol dehydrogenase n=1 Tax=Guyanagaster necrorhizus TaxID=856835 RepID=A0A9P7VQ15_9AGAR|nr:uncharacterized protein BT62DRAFT_1007576 [Guyanagaster necrorhizus MCA 3950]KAG7444580.1 hypothetical protein BT62DRAFT_1007576 [Guyanagaster necrorhizus MCA 3950]